MRSQTMPMSRPSRSIPWWALLLPGFVVVIVGVLLIVAPRDTASGVFMVVGGAAILGGMIALISLALNRVMWGYKLFGGLAAILIGLGAGRSTVVRRLLARGGRAVDPRRRRAAGRCGPRDRGAILRKLDADRTAAKGGLMVGGGVICLIAGFGIVLGSAMGPLKAPWLYGLAVIAAGVGVIAGGLNMRQRA